MRLLTLRDFMMVPQVWFQCPCLTRRLLERFMPIVQTSTRFSLLAFQIPDHRGLEPDLLEELRICNSKKGNRYLRSLTASTYSKVQASLTFYFRVTSFYIMARTLILSPGCSWLTFLWALWQKENISVFFQLLLYKLWHYNLFLFMYKSSYVLCLHKLLHANQIIKWKIISTGVVV